MKVNNNKNSREGSVAGGGAGKQRVVLPEDFINLCHNICCSWTLCAQQSSAAQHSEPCPLTTTTRTPLHPSPPLAPTVGLTWLLVYSLYTSYFLSSFLNCGCLGPATCPASSLCTSPGTTTATTTTRRKKPRKLARRNTHGVVEVLLLRSITMQNFWWQNNLRNSEKEIWREGERNLSLPTLPRPLLALWNSCSAHIWHHISMFVKIRRAKPMIMHVK